MSMKRLAVIAAVSSHNGYHNQQQNNTNFNIEKSVNHQGLQTMRSSGGSNSGNTTSLHGNVNIMLGGAMLSVVITVVCFVCYCCHRNIKKRTASAYRQQRWLENDPNMEIYSVEQCYDTSGLFIEQHHHHHHQSDQISIQPTSNLHGPPPSYEAVVALDEIIGRNLNLNFNNNNNNNNNNFYNNNNDNNSKENLQTNNNINLDNNFILEKLKQTTNSDGDITNIIIDENIFTQLRNENVINNQMNNGEIVFNKKIIDNDDEYEYTNQIITNAAIAALANRKRNKRILYCNCNKNEFINNNNNNDDNNNNNNNNNDKCSKCNQIINKTKNFNVMNVDNEGGACSSLGFVKTMDNNSPVSSTPTILTPAPTPILEINDICQFNINNNNNNNELILENNIINNDINDITSIIITNNNNYNDINDNLNNNNMIDDNFILNNNNNNLEIFATTPAAATTTTAAAANLQLTNNNNEEFLNNNNNNNINPIDFTSLNENGLIRLDMSKIIDKTGLPTYEAALKLKSSGYV